MKEKKSTKLKQVNCNNLMVSRDNLMVSRESKKKMVITFSMSQIEHFIDMTAA